MYIVYPNKIASVSADEENANYPVTNLETDYIKEVWKATSKDAELTLNVSGNSNTAILFGCNAISATVTIDAGLEGVFAAIGDGHDGAEFAAIGDGHDGAEFAAYEYDLPISYEYNELETGVGTLEITYDNLDFPHSIVIDLETKEGTILEAGVAIAGSAITFEDPLNGVREGLIDYSIRRELSNGAWYIKKRDIVRRFSFEFTEERDTDFYTFMHEIVLLHGIQPMAWRISEKLTSMRYVVYAMLENMPEGVHEWPKHSNITVNLREVV